MTITEALEALLPTDDDIAAYRARGWYVSKTIVPDEVLDTAIEGADRYYLGELHDGPPIHDRFIPTPPIPPGLRKHDYSSLRRRELAALVRLPVISAIGARLMGATEVRLWHDQLLYKPPSHGDVKNNVGWHTDRSYWKACTSADMVTAWVPFHTITLEHGPLMVIEGSNTWGREDQGRPDFFRQDIDVQEQEIARDTGRRVVKTPVLLERGQVSFHHCRTFHGSGPNRSAEPRRSLAIHMQPGENRSAGHGPDGNVIWHANNELARLTDDGLPDYTDPRYFPVLYPPA